MDDKLTNSNIFGGSNVNKNNHKNEFFTTQDVIEDFLKSISKSYLNCFAVKGCMALNHHFINTKLPCARMTQDLDLHCYSREDWEEFVRDSAEIATKNSSLGLSYKLIGRRGFDKNPNGDSLKFGAESEDGFYKEFKIDMNFGGDVDIVSYNDSISFYSIPVILSDKLTVFATRKICRRIKDLIDIYLICSNFNLSYFDLCSDISNRLKSSGRTIDFNNLYFLGNNSIDEMKHAFEMYNQSSSLAISFEDLFKVVLDFSVPIYFCLNRNPINVYNWDYSKKEWL